MGPRVAISRRHLLDEGALLAAEPAKPAIDALAARRPGHAPAEQRMQVEMDQRRLVAPIFEGARFLRVIGGLFEEAPVIGADAREERHVMRPHQDVDRIDLEQVRALEDAAQVARLAAPVAPSPKPLCRQRNAPGLGEGERVRGHGANNTGTGLLDARSAPDRAGRRKAGGTCGWLSSP